MRASLWPRNPRLYKKMKGPGTRPTLRPLAEHSILRRLHNHRARKFVSLRMRDGPVFVHDGVNRALLNMQLTFLFAEYFYHPSVFDNAPEVASSPKYAVAHPIRIAINRKHRHRDTARVGHGISRRAHIAKALTEMIAANLGRFAHV